ncbi:SIS domain-containing protein [Candidatus Omnitrophota bacterium]
MRDRIKKIITEHLKAVQTLQRDTAVIETIVKRIRASLAAGGKLLICGNGGSAADAQHMAAEFVGRFKKKRAPLAALSLSTDTSIITSVGNDFGFTHIFANQVKALGKKEDILIVLSTSGNSANIIAAVRAAKKIKMATVGILGKGGGRLKKLVDLTLVARSSQTPRIQEIHALVIHTICELSEL